MDNQAAVQELKKVNEQISDLNAFADMKTTKEVRANIMMQWAALSQEREYLIKKIRGRHDN